MRTYSAIPFAITLPAKMAAAGCQSSMLIAVAIVTVVIVTLTLAYTLYDDSVAKWCTDDFDLNPDISMQRWALP